MTVKTKSYIYQHGTLGGLMQDLMDGTEKIGTLSNYGDFGLGTLEGSNGEIIFLDGVIYHADETGKINQLTGDELTPYAAVTNFESDEQFSLANSSDDTVKAAILEKVSHNLFAAVKIEGTFKHMHVRVAPKQEKPYPRFVEIARHQPEFEADDIAGTIVGFFTPNLFQGAAAAGFHLHFISDDRKFGGHVLDFELTDGKIDLMELAEFRQHFPTENADYLKNEIKLDDITKDIEEAE
ncbi:acetolactate decarboxylase [Enterococcus malodoratus]|uniref:Alpha-acetolactate decarboxylase n=1 Tax=Enterococcus malodoratus ATCC 43197 TaxID=1158601 RepID=R2RFD9_9ENTE|nr:acetolactate decarboxylase [Enterococcus malodoratus]EOH79331.1 alpha-acetolactate decarboxylase [Enterococcus malodoratus ATCC 43197]EOT64910.1 alpha-acetolactate decarboxylase [Enterococcus malodoratus ATCC 43197]OJG62163.1 alpha-acetolactate decarboxylase [Enterococcus malodoratus]SPX03738.1 alpha-acetolactate decarboxylase [Enterococcus malodoratus]STC72183.1 alpha-acetolactate decarboxylase [Enterococcus malodoratus]